MLLRLGLSLGVVGAAIGMTSAAGDVVARCGDAAAVAGDPSHGTTLTCTPARAEAAGRVPGAAAPAADRAAASVGEMPSPAPAALIALATGLVFLSIFAILLSYRLRPGGVRTSHR
jgi:hypothetical protein